MLAAPAQEIQRFLAVVRNRDAVGDAAVAKGFERQANVARVVLNEEDMDLARAVSFREEISATKESNWRPARVRVRTLSATRWKCTLRI
ncbi:MAG: hypothetical protein ACREN2_07170 [Candidatus Dormibacteria bacterium]